VSYAIVDGTIRISVTADRAKTANMARDPRVVFHISDPSAYTYLSFDGTAVVSPSATAPDDPQIDDLVDLYRAVGGKEHPDWDEYRRAMVDDRRAVVTITPTSVVGMINA
jgi:PPOX class probable F420-dependent enzyme